MLRGDAKESGKRKYELEGRGLVAEVKPDDRGFKVRTIEGVLLWKVTMAGDTIKVSNNEEHTNPFLLESKGADRVKVARDTTELGAVRFYRDRGKIKVENAAGVEQFESNTTRYSPMYGLVLITEIPDTERFIVMAEVLARGQ